MKRADLKQCFKIDMHVHSIYSRDAFTEPRVAIRYALKKGLNGIAITDHCSVKGGILAKKYSSNKIVVIPGIEVKSPYGHFLLLNIEKPPAKLVSIFEIFEWCRLQGGLVVLAHPYSMFPPIRGLNKVVRYVDAVEIVNSNSFFLRRSVKQALRLAQRNKLGKTGGSDSHIPQTIGLAYTILDDYPSSVDDILTYVKRGKCKIHCGKISLHNRILRLAKRVSRF